MLAWSPTGYVDGRPRFDADVVVLTPRCTVNVMGAGYRPVVHESAALTAARRRGM
jgi:hypothetical protein